MENSKRGKNEKRLELAEAYRECEPKPVQEKRDQFVIAFSAIEEHHCFRYVTFKTIG